MKRLFAVLSVATVASAALIAQAPPAGQTPPPAQPPAQQQQQRPPQPPLGANEWRIDGNHSAAHFSVRHLMVSTVRGQLGRISGTIEYDGKDVRSIRADVSIDVNGIDTQNEGRDKHLRSDDFLNVAKHPTATFESTSVKSTGEGTADITGNLTLNGVTKPVVIAAKFIGEGDDPWGGYRAGFEGSTTLTLKDFDIKMDLGPASQTVDLIISVEGVRK